MPLCSSSRRYNQPRRPSTPHGHSDSKSHRHQHLPPASQRQQPARGWQWALHEPRYAQPRSSRPRGPGRRNPPAPAPKAGGRVKTKHRQKRTPAASCRLPSPKPQQGGTGAGAPTPHTANSSRSPEEGTKQEPTHPPFPTVMVLAGVCLGGRGE